MATKPTPRGSSSPKAGRAQGKQAATSVLARTMTMLTLLPLKPPGRTSQQITDALADRGYGVDKRTVERNLVELSARFPIVCEEETTPYRWYWLPGGNPYLQQLAHRLAAVAGKTSHPGRKARSEIPLALTPIDEFATWMGVTEAEVLEDFHSGSLNGALIGGRWHVLELVVLSIPDRNRRHKALLRLAATRDGKRLSAGGGVVEIALTYDESQIDRAVERLFRALDAKKDRLVSITLGRREFEIHDSLWQALGNALLQWQLEMDLVTALEARGATRRD
jgi:hypothetical protein